MYICIYVYNIMIYDNGKNAGGVILNAFSAPCAAPVRLRIHIYVYIYIYIYTYIYIYI